jgi:hypothetical protein
MRGAAIVSATLPSARGRRVRCSCPGTKILTDPIACAAEKASADEQAGNLLADLERRQDDVLAQLDELDRRVSDLLRGLGVTLIEDSEAVQFVDESDDATEAAASTPPSASAAQSRTVSNHHLGVDDAANRAIASELTVGFAKLPQGDTRARNPKRSQTGFNESSGWDQKSRAA